MSRRYGGIDAVLGLLGMILGFQVRATDSAQKETRDALAALKMPTPKFVMPQSAPKPPEEPPQQSRSGVRP